MTCPQLVANWSGTGAQIAAGQMALSEIVQREDIPTLADVNRVHGNKTSLEIIAEHLISVVCFAGIKLTKDQASESALVVLSGYYYLNLAELALFFHQLKCGKFGQFVWGQKINNQAIMVALHDFATQRSKAIERIITEQTKQETSGDTIKKFGSLMTGGIENHFDKCVDFDIFLETFPVFKGEKHAKEWHDYFLRNRNAALWAIKRLVQSIVQDKAI